MKLHHKIVFFIIQFLFIGTTLAQSISQKEFEARMPDMLHSIAVKIRKAAISNDIPVYATDSLTTRLSREWVLIKGSFMVVEQKPNYRNPNDPTDLIDTAYYLELKEDSILSDLDINYEISTGVDFQKNLKLRAIAPMFKYKLANMVYQLPLFWLDKKDFEKIFTKNEIDFIKAYSWFKSFEPSQYIYYFSTSTGSVKRAGLEAAMVDPVQMNTVSYNGNWTVEVLGSFISNTLCQNLFEKYNQNAFVLQSVNGPITPDSFISKHKYSVVTNVVNWLEPYDPTDLIDTMYWEIPRQFDSIAFEKKGNKMLVVFKQIDRMNEGKYPAPMNSYTTPLEALKPLLHPAVYTIITSIL